MPSFMLILKRCVFLVVLGIISLFIYAYLSYKSPSIERIGSWEGATAAYRVSLPIGTGFRLLLGVSSDDAKSIPDMTGRVVVATLHDVLLDQPIKESDIIPASWLSRKGLQGYILTGHGNELSQVFSSTLNHAKQVDMTITLIPDPPTNATLWIGYIESVFHRIFAADQIDIVPLRGGD